MNKNLSTLVGAFMALALVATACGGSDSGSASAADQEVIDAVAEQLRAEELPDSIDANCMATAMVNGLGGADAMEAEFGLDVAAIQAGENPDEVELSRDQAISLADGVMGCGVSEIMVAEMTGDGMSEADASCLFENIDQDLIRDVFASEFMSEADADSIMANAESNIGSAILSAFGSCDIDPLALGG